MLKNSTCENCDMPIAKGDPLLGGRWYHDYWDWRKMVTCDMRITRTKDLLVAVPKAGD